MPEKTPAARGQRLVDALIVWITPDRQLEPGINRASATYPRPRRRGRGGESRPGSENFPLWDEDRRRPRGPSARPGRPGRGLSSEATQRPRGVAGGRLARGGPRLTTAGTSSSTACRCSCGTRLSSTSTTRGARPCSGRTSARPRTSWPTTSRRGHREPRHLRHQERQLAREVRTRRELRPDGRGAARGLPPADHTRRGGRSRR